MLPPPPAALPMALTVLAGRQRTWPPSAAPEHDACWTGPSPDVQASAGPSTQKHLSFLTLLSSEFDFLHETYPGRQREVEEKQSGFWYRKAIRKENFRTPCLPPS